MTCLEFTATVLQRLVAAGFEVVPTPAGFRAMDGCSPVTDDAHPDEMGAWLDVVSHVAGSTS